MAPPHPLPPALAVVLVASLVAGGCYRAQTTPRPVQDEMHAHLDEADRLRTSAVRADGDGVRRAARELYDRGVVVGIPSGSRPVLFDLRETARELSATENLDEAVRRAPEVARACGRCHLESGVALEGRLAAGTAPTGEGVERHRERLGWAVERLWDGVAGPSDAAWSAGVSALDDPASVATVVREGVRPLAGPEEASERLLALAWQAGLTREAGARARLLGDVLLTCARCHGSLESPG